MKLNIIIMLKQQINDIFRMINVNTSPFRNDYRKRALHKPIQINTLYYVYLLSQRSNKFQLKSTHYLLPTLGRSFYINIPHPVILKKKVIKGELRNF